MNVVNCSAHAFDASPTRWLIAERMGMGVHCQNCARHVVMDPATL